MKMVYYGKYLEYFESGRSDLLRSIGLPYPEIEHLGYLLPVVEAHARYFKSARYDDLIEVSTILRERPLAKIRIEYQIREASSHELLAEGYTVHSFVNAATSKPVRAPAPMLEAIDEAFRLQATRKDALPT